MKRSLFSLVAALALLAAMAVPVAAHRQTVTPPGQDAPVILLDPISNSWAQAHCNSAAPGVVAGASKGVVVFTPQGALPCPPVPNPGGQITGP
jgi:hypothetical protein